MSETRVEKNDEIEIDFGRVMKNVARKSWLIALVSLLCAAVAFLTTFFAISPKYQASAKFYVNNNSISVGNTSVSLSSGDLTTSRNLVDSYIVILNTRETLNDVIEYAEVNRTYERLEKMLSADAVDNTEIFKVTVTSTDPLEAEKIANAIAYILPKRISTIIEGTSAKVVEAAVIPVKPSSPSYSKNTAIGFLLGFVLMVGIVALREIFDTTIRTEEDIAQSCGYPVLTSVPDMTVSGKGGHYYGYGEKQPDTTAKEPVLIGGGISFAASEAYKLLRTKLQFSFSDENACRVIGISSGLSGEGKSLSAVNLAYSLSELGMRVVLLDCDMRRPTLAKKLGINKAPGLSNYLTRQSDLVSLLQPCGIQDDPNAFHVIAAGPNPPNPVELLSSERMASALKSLRKLYDYVILDLPPVSEVSDAMAIADQTDGILLVVRQNYCDRGILEDTVRQFKFINAKLLGIVFNSTTVNTGKYGKSYYKKYGSKYERAYEAAAARSKKAEKKAEKAENKPENKAGKKQ